ncbi:GPCR rhodopsin-like 7TM [Trinorchestia longiramus]|nr:GPCR rhodopsin-like 7TM [Trinorchestia longiramus]
MMRPLTYSSIGQCAAAPLVFLTSAWVLGVFHSYRRQWLSVDLFLLAISVQELVMALQVFIYALISLVQLDWDGACAALVWSLNATRTLQFATVMSLLADRALTCHWPYRYRFSVRRHQLRYHLAVLAAMASLLGVAALITRPYNQLDNVENSSEMYCATMPYLLNIRLSLFLLAVYGIFLLVGMLSIAVVQTSRGCFSSPDKDDLTQTVTNTTSSTSSTQRPPLSTSSTNTVSSHGRKPVQNSASRASSTSSSVGAGNLGLRAASSTADLLPVVPTSARSGVLRTSSGSAPGGSDFRWRTTVSVALLCCLLNHLPYLLHVYGHQLHVHGHQLHVHGHQLHVHGHQLHVHGHQLHMHGHQLHVHGHQLHVHGHQLHVHGHQLHVHGHQMHVHGHQLHVHGHQLHVHGHQHEVMVSAVPGRCGFRLAKVDVGGGKGLEMDDPVTPWVWENPMGGGGGSMRWSRTAPAVLLGAHSRLPAGHSMHVHQLGNHRPMGPLFPRSRPCTGGTGVRMLQHNGVQLWHSTRSLRRFTDLTGAASGRAYT